MINPSLITCKEKQFLVASDSTEKISVFHYLFISIYLLKRFRSSLNTFQKPPEGVVKIINGWKVWEKTQRKGGITLLCLANFRIKSYEVMFSSAFLLIKLEGCLLMIFNKGRPILNVMLKTLTWIYRNHKRISAKITRIISLPMSNPWLKGLISMELNSNIRCQTHWWTCLNFDIPIQRVYFILNLNLQINLFIHHFS